MKQKKPTHTPGPAWKIANNTDTVDIDQGCIGLDPFRGSIPRDVWDHLQINRGLHIQIRHNKDKQTFNQASDLARLIAAAPNLESVVSLLVQLLKDCPQLMKASEVQQLNLEAIEALKKARGE